MSAHERNFNPSKKCIESLKWNLRYDLAQKHAYGRVLDVACGYGHAAPLFDDYTGVDNDEQVIRAARDKNPRKAFVVADATSLPFADGVFDTVVSLETVEHIQDSEAFIIEITRVLKPSGLLIISTPNPNPYPNPYHVREIRYNELMVMLRDFYTIKFAHGYSLQGYVAGIFVYEAFLTILQRLGFSDGFVTFMMRITDRTPKIALNYLAVAQKIEVFA